MIEIGIIGVGGRMGRMLVQAISEKSQQCRLVAASEHPNSPFIGKDAGELAGVGTLGVPIVSDTGRLFATGRVIIDFTRPDVTLSHLGQAERVGSLLVIGTTGFNEKERARIATAAQQIPIVLAPNFSVGINLLMRVVAEMAPILEDSFDIEIIEAHHRHKVDAPSGTALGLGRAIAGALGRDLQEVAVYGREGITGERERSTIGFATVRGGDIVGDHTVLFAGEGERLEVTHRASSRMTFAKGAIRAAIWLAGRGAGLYDMSDVLNFDRGGRD
ncbi:4-hydroxy-tetrahydrodipicolinate reductase [Candidatus Magnetaquicoccus inordinatus]|uniref:4-hydroxy-tetrahydrodipicolinate reductase n=1 Tax=Candidatus Magnetaquicoccus inordinatus TaxID=2496818 RepID=UPI00102C9BDA|nr:4-hydroxy-tetrahydrodipicolinate reductase [Candidatus Magnetaquicoccus inordinatus]